MGSGFRHRNLTDIVDRDLKGNFRLNNGSGISSITRSESTSNSGSGSRIKSRGDREISSKNDSSRSGKDLLIPDDDINVPSKWDIAQLRKLE